MDFSSKPKDTGKIIVAEDQLHNMQVIKQQLAQLEKEEQCEFVYNGQEAVVRVADLLKAGQTVSYILTDFMMPRLNGIQAVQKIQTYIQTLNSQSPVKIADPKVVFLTAYKTSAFDSHIKNLNVSAVFEKPLSLEQLQSIFEE